MISFAHRGVGTLRKACSATDIFCFLLTTTGQDVRISFMFKELLAALGDLVFPPTCHVCGALIRRDINAYDAHLCRSCAAAFKVTPPVSCRSCGEPLRADDDGTRLSCQRCLDRPLPAYQDLTTCYLYQGGIRTLIHKFKYANRPYLAATIFRLMDERLTDARLTAFDAVVPVPLHPVRLREREFNQAELIAELLARRWQRPLIKALTRKVNTRPQSILTQTERKANVSEAFEIRTAAAIQGKRLLLVDDIVTTTATTRAASRCLKDAGAGQICVLAFAKG